MVDTQKLHHMAGHLIMWSYDTKKQLTLKKDKDNGHVASHVCLATWIAYITSKYIAVPKSEIALFTPLQAS